MLASNHRHASYTTNKARALVNKLATEQDWRCDHIQHGRGLSQTWYGSRDIGRVRLYKTTWYPGPFHQLAYPDDPSLYTVNEHYSVWSGLEGVTVEQVQQMVIPDGAVPSIKDYDGEGELFWRFQDEDKAVAYAESLNG
jgi:hypothetical protein